MALLLSFPLVEVTVTQRFGNKLIIDGQDIYARWGYPGHNGIDFRAAVGTPVIACDDGVVELTGEDPDGFGFYVRVRHPWGLSFYAHLSQKFRTDSVVREQAIGLSGDSGFRTAPHLHFGVKVWQAPCPGYRQWSDPTLFLHEQPECEARLAAKDAALLAIENEAKAAQEI